MSEKMRSKEKMTPPKKKQISTTFWSKPASDLLKHRYEGGKEIRKKVEKYDVMRGIKGERGKKRSARGERRGG